MTRDAEGFEHRHVDLGEVTLHCVIEGDGPLLVLLHGFPEFWYSWRHQIHVLAQAGYRVVAPDMRGYNLSSKPEGVESYAIERLIGDVSRLIEKLDTTGRGRATIVSHDWGGFVTWVFAMLRPDQLDRLVVMNCPHPVRFARGIRTWKQMKKSWYMLFFQIPRLPESILRLGRFEAIRRIFRREPIRRGAVSRDEIERYVEAMSQPGAARASINYYRARTRKSLRIHPSRYRPIEKPVMVIWGERDRHLGVELSRPDERWVPGVRVERIPDASHWVQVDQPDRVNELLLDFLGPRSSHDLACQKR